MLAVPDLRADLQAWWRVVDVNGDGRLSRHELIEALKAQLPMRRRLVGRALLGTGSPNLRCRRSCRSTPRSWMTHWPTRRIGCGSSGTRTALPPLSCPANRHAAALALASSRAAPVAAALAATLAPTVAPTAVASSALAAALAAAAAAAHAVAAPVDAALLGAGLAVRQPVRRVRQLVEWDGRLPAERDVGRGAGAVQ